MTFGTESIPKVYKFLVLGTNCNSGEAISNSICVAIDMPAGPSELLIVADDSSVLPLSLLIYYLKQNTVQTAK
jgi:histidinol dehydrogenase